MATYQLVTYLLVTRQRGTNTYLRQESEHKQRHEINHLQSLIAHRVRMY
jgi:hypothetical protein